MSAYNYCGGNPVVFVDNNGDTLVIKYWWGGHEETYLYSGPTTKVEVDNEFVKTVVETLNYLYGYEESRSNIQTLMLSRRNVAISEVSEISEDAPGKAKARILPTRTGERIFRRAEVFWCPTLGVLLVDNDGDYIGGSQSPSLVLDHELTHVVHALEDPTAYYENLHTEDSDYQNLEERLTIEGHESGAADYFGEYKRTNHSYGGTFRYYGGTHSQESKDIYEDFSGPSIDRGRGSTNQIEIKLKTRE